MNTAEQKISLRAIIGLGNPGEKYVYTRHNIGFRVIDALAEFHHVEFKKNDHMLLSTIDCNGAQIFLIKPQTFMNESGKVISFLQKKGITADQILVVHDELELPFGEIKFKTGGSAKGHNGLKSIIQFLGADFHRLRVGIGRPIHKEAVPDYVLQKFKESEISVQEVVDRCVTLVEHILAPNP